jgi:hypothetical protein
MRRKAYQMRLEHYGEVGTLQAGFHLAVLLINANRTIEAWRLLKKSIAISTQYHGHEHRHTKQLEQAFATIKYHKIHLVTLGLNLQAIGYEEAKYVVQGPIDVPEEQMQILRVDPTDVILVSNGIPVVCHGLKNNAAFLNGKIGDIRSFDETTGRYGVYFEDESIKPKCVKLRNLQILFELPDD